MTPTSPVPSSSGAQGKRLPRLTKRQLGRLVEIGLKFPKGLHSDSKPATTDFLRWVKCILSVGERRCGNVWLTPPELSLTPLGIRILAGLPGEEFDCFRAAISTEKRARFEDERCVKLAVHKPRRVKRNAI